MSQFYLLARTILDLEVTWTLWEGGVCITVLVLSFHFLHAIFFVPIITPITVLVVFPTPVVVKVYVKCWD
jgi:hypothetical protein